jgi:hypothetical protein
MKEKINTLTKVKKCKHKWDREKGKRTKSRPWVGIKSRIIRTCIICGYREEFNKGPIFFGWYNVKHS